MSAAILREAAALMRSRAEAATPGPWVAPRRGKGPWCGGCADPLHGDDGACYGVLVRTEDAAHIGWQLLGATGHDERRGVGDSQHIASWHPAVALTVADWLDACADSAEYIPAETGQPSLALAVAAAYLGRAA